jgi:hypothetical protein
VIKVTLASSLITGRQSAAVFKKHTVLYLLVTNCKLASVGQLRIAGRYSALRAREASRLDNKYVEVRVRHKSSTGFSQPLHGSLRSSHSKRFPGLVIR